MVNPNKAPKKGTKLQRDFGVTDEEKKRAVATDYVIDTNKRGKLGDEPKMTD